MNPRRTGQQGVRLEFRCEPSARKDADNVHSPLNLGVGAFERICRCELRAMRLREAQEGANVVSIIIEIVRELWEFLIARNCTVPPPPPTVLASAATLFRANTVLSEAELLPWHDVRRSARCVKNNRPAQRRTGERERRAVRMANVSTARVARRSRESLPT
jgi:hypothetical protein